MPRTVRRYSHVTPDAKNRAKSFRPNMETEEMFLDDLFILLLGLAILLIFLGGSLAAYEFFERRRR